ncbi:MAG: hypothetical protein QM811_21200 [Pirellulales bacterium]
MEETSMATRKNGNGKRKKLTMKDVEAAAERLKNWGKWGPDDEIGTLNFTTPEDIVDRRAAGDERAR